ncbi:MAG TPA: hypothetical protein VGN78_11320 [Solirubrobacteraceae bacterium]|nr:hypothetical protein [Solirubrobacteraceae bacterium]
MNHRLAILGVLGAALAGCGSQSHSATTTSGGTPAATATHAAPTLPRPPQSAGASGNGSVAQAGAICQGFVTHLNRGLVRGMGSVSPQGAAALYSELEGLSRRLQFLSGSATARAGAAHWAADLDRAAITANRLAGMEVASAGGRRRYVAALTTERRELDRANADAAGLGLRSCHIAVEGAPGGRPPR